MQYFTVNLKDIYDLEHGCTVTAMIHSNSKEVDLNRRRPALVIFPGGGYRFVSEREGEPVAEEFFNRDYNVFVVEYSTAPIRYPNQLLQAACAIDYVRKNADNFLIFPDKVFVMGFSAGGHLAGNITVDSQTASKLYGKTLDAKPNGTVLSYPVINAEYGHTDSYVKLSGEDKKDYSEFAIDKRVTPTTPPVFMWHAANDGCVNSLNSIMMAKALKENGVRFELHIYPCEGHGMALCNQKVYKDGGLPDFYESMKKWYELADVFLKSLR